MNSILTSLTILPEKSKPARRRKSKLPTWRQRLDRALAWLVSRNFARRPRRLHLRDTVCLGEKRFVAVVEFEDRRFLLGGAANSVSLLAHLTLPSFANALSTQIRTGEK
jgi:hypothetical protein